MSRGPILIAGWLVFGSYVFGELLFSFFALMRSAASDDAELTIADDPDAALPKPSRLFIVLGWLEPKPGAFGTTRQLNLQRRTAEAVKMMRRPCRSTSIFPETTA